MANNQLTIHIDNRIRLMSAVLAVTDLPDRAQHRKGHRPHAHARKTTKHLEAFREHPAVQGAQALINHNAPVHALFAYAMKLNWEDMSIDNPPPWTPPNWNLQLQDFYQQSHLEDFWSQENGVWQKAKREASEILADTGYYEFLKPFVGDVSENFVYMPNISYPSDHAVGVRVGSDIVCIGPPRIAWGDNEPWPFNEEAAYIYSTSLGEYTRLLILSYLRHHTEAVSPIAQEPLPVDDEFKQRYRTWGDQFVELFVPASVAIYLQQKMNHAEAKSFILMERRENGITALPGAVNVLERYLSEYESGKYTDFISFLPNFPKYLRVAKRITLL